MQSKASGRTSCGYFSGNIRKDKRLLLSPRFPRFSVPATGTTIKQDRFGRSPFQREGIQLSPTGRTPVKVEWNQGRAGVCRRRRRSRRIEEAYFRAESSRSSFV